MAIESFRAASSIRQGRCVSLAQSPNVGIEETRLDDIVSISKIVGIAMKDIAPGFSGNVAINGIVEMKKLWSFKNINEPVYVWDYGYLDQKVPSKLVVPVGFAVSATELLVRIPDYIVRK